ncbi:uncharacterized protein LOC122243060 [Penaeus japonicus]|uniref:uncharacterized protein LOC122243060 n=1 Tax=Penaeus japonicus TaxID=27405 RepID=UPI001C715970|nr:uncharacterized protein LOC122243060 [Penaeus japonicus]
MWFFVGLWAGTSVGLSAAAQSFPVAVEENQSSLNSDGTYLFSYDTGSGEHQSFRTEERDAKGRVSGRFGYVDPDGALRITEYHADTEGYRANMLIYHRVNSVPRSPLLVGPLPQRAPPVAAGVDGGGFRAPSGPVGPIPFFPPKGPVLIIGPLPKPLQPKGILSSSQEFEEIFLDTTAPSSSGTSGRGSNEREGQLDSSSEGTLEHGRGASLQGALGEFPVSSSQRNVSSDVISLAPANRTGDNFTTTIESREKSEVGQLIMDTKKQNLSVILLSAVEGTVLQTLKLLSVNASISNSTTKANNNTSDQYLQNVPESSVANFTRGRKNGSEYKTPRPLKGNTTQRVKTELLSAARLPTPVLHLETPNKEYPFPSAMDLPRKTSPDDNITYNFENSSTAEIEDDLLVMTSEGNLSSRSPSSAVVIRFDSPNSTLAPARKEETYAINGIEGEKVTDKSHTVTESTISPTLPPLFYLPVDVSPTRTNVWDQLPHER